MGDDATDVYGLPCEVGEEVGLEVTKSEIQDIAEG